MGDRDRLVSGNGVYELVLQDDGNLVIYRAGVPLWASNTEQQPDTDPPPDPGTVANLNLRGRQLYAGDRVFRWRGITAFALLAMIAQGRRGEAEAWMAAQQARGFNVFRVLSMCSWLELGPGRGQEVLPQLLQLVKARGVGLELVALSDTRAFGFSPSDCREQVQRIRELSGNLAPGQVLVQAANEHYHGTHVDWLHDPANVDGLAAGLPLTTASPAAEDEALVPTGGYVTRHLDRGRDKWNMVRRVRELEAVSGGTGKFVVNDEPIGAAEANQPGRRESDPSIFFTFGVLGRIFEVGSTFHCEAGLRCDPLVGNQLACAQVFVQGATIVPDDRVLAFQNANNPRPDGSRPWPDSPVQWFDEGAAVRCYTGVCGDEAWTCALGLSGDPRIQWHTAWQPEGVVAQLSGVQVIKLRRR